MDRDEALKLLKGGPAGITEWNRRREAGEEVPDLVSANLSRANLRSANLSINDFIGPDLSNADLSEAILCEADLNEALLIEANLSRADLSNADLLVAQLRRADLSRANFERASLGGADLSEANLSGASLFRAMLVDCTLSRATLKQADLTEATLRGVDLSGANLQSAKCSRTVFVNVDLSNVEGLGSIEHGGPSSIGIDTLFRSRGKIPEEFLRGCGMPDVLIEYLPSLINSMNGIQFHSVFISYSHKDEEFGERLHNELQGNGVRCWFAPHDLPIGSRIRPVIDSSIQVYDKLLLVLSEHSVHSQWVEQEVETALRRERENNSTVLFPVRLDDSAFSIKAGWPALITNTRHIGDFRKWKEHDNFEATFGRLLRDLKAAGENGDGTPPATDASP